MNMNIKADLVKASLERDELNTKVIALQEEKLEMQDKVIRAESERDEMIGT